MGRPRGSWLVFPLVVALCLAGNAVWVDMSVAQSPQITVDWSAALGQGPEGYGTNVWWTDQDAALWQSRYEESASTMFRLPISHAILEPINDNDDASSIEWTMFQFETTFPVPDGGRTSTYRAWFEALRDSGVTILMHPSYLAPWLSDNASHPGGYAPYPPNDWDEYREFLLAVLRYLVETINFPPQRIVLEAMNEPDLGCGVDPVVPCFWQDWTMADIAATVRVSQEAIEAVDEDIALVGLAECCGTDVVETLLADYPTESAYLDGFSYHRYSSGYDITALLERGETLKAYGRPVYADEYGSLSYRSEGTAGGLWHSYVLGELWRAGIAPLQYPFSEWPTLGEPYNSMGLFHDWREDWTIKPAYWVYANFYTHLGGTIIVSSTAPTGLDVVAGKKSGEDGAALLAVWVTNRSGTAYSGVQFEVTDFPQDEATLTIYDTMAGLSPVGTQSVSGTPLAFSADLPASSSRCFVVRAPWLTERVYLPVTLREYVP
ncbi:MAG: hypothetical protein H5T62_14135 [Anaerolineae bacterium]|nr:hypothetical protein [Anaerolineae bacterium]